MVLLGFAVCLAAGTLLAPAAPATQPKKSPDHVVIIVLDQARPDTVTRYGMKNVQKLQARGKNFPNGIVGHMAAETVISHNVLTSGLFPKHMGWTNEVYRDVGNVLNHGEGAYYVTSSMTCNQFRDLIQHGQYDKLQDYLDMRFPNGDFASIAQKRTSACTSGWTRSLDAGDIIFQIRGGGSSMNCDARSSWRQPEYVGPAGFFDLSTCSRWYTWQGSGAYGTGGISPANIYPLEGNRFVPGFDPAHLGGDTWSADAAIHVIDNDPNWRGMMVSLGAIDKMGHMWGPEDNVTGPPGSDAEVSHLPFAAKNADIQVGRIVRALKRRGLRDDTLIVITADHAAQTGTPGSSFFGRLDGFGTAGNGCDPATPTSLGAIRSDCNWYFGTETGAGEAESYRDPSPAVSQLNTTLGGNVAFSYQDGHVAVWLTDNSLLKKQEAAEAVLHMPGVIAGYHLDAAQDDYVRFGTNAMDDAEQDWFDEHADELVDTMAAPNGPDVVGLVKTNVTYGVVGDHGGHNRLIQNIPMVFSGPGVNPKDSNIELRHVDVLPTILEAMGIDYDPDDLDGEAVDLSQVKP
jgi:hypothetical protein